MDKNVQTRGETLVKKKQKRKFTPQVEEKKTDIV